ncbi:relaxase/mobilization nuclease domain-containing protein [Dyadobacter psychrotolerans]|uniref:Relaxase n=1 Tax=Dyadobacter psychrotolerans TaxID=2541721 RepID=A0A4V2Z4U2_9BACT|nr:relaxase/mobilization nuclease domain-containing protein [Dyadobacter psychrotolerans]TDE18038.1 relaxase [Dyadobacter psychrotolerans]
MVAVIHASGSLRSALNYNERKVREGAADFLDAGYYLQNPQKLNFQNKLSRLASRNALNPRVKVNTLHISLNFAPDEKLSSQQLKAIAGSYLAKIGFEKQPYLLYEHRDSGHPHVHLITSSIRADGSAIRLHNLGKNQSEKARKELESEFGLVRAQDQNQGAYQLKPANLTVAEYGKSQTKKAIRDVLQGVLHQYKFCSLPELNAVLSQYNVTAERGTEGSRIYKKQGLVYRLLDRDGQKIGVPVKASDFHFKPTLKSLNGRFAANEPERLKYRPRLKNLIDLTLLNRRHSLESLSESLKKQGVQMLVRRSEQGLVYGLTYVDLRTQCVFNGSALGKAYSAKAILERCTDSPSKTRNTKVFDPDLQQSSHPKAAGQRNFTTGSKDLERVLSQSHQGQDKLLYDLFSPEFGSENVPWQLAKTRRKKRKKVNR